MLQSVAISLILCASPLLAIISLMETLVKLAMMLMSRAILKENALNLPSKKFLFLC